MITQIVISAVGAFLVALFAWLFAVYEKRQPALMEARELSKIKQMIDTLESIKKVQGNLGSPIKGPVKRKNTSPYKKKYIFFSLVILLSHQQSLALLSPFFASVIDQHFTDPRQSPIRIKTIVL